MSQHEANIEAKIDQKSIQNRFKICLKFDWILEYLGEGQGLRAYGNVMVTGRSGGPYNN